MFHNSSEPIADSPIASPRQLESNLIKFKQVVRNAEIAYRMRHYAASAALCEVAALTAVGQHPGIFSSLQLEKILQNIGAKALPSNSEVKRVIPSGIRAGSILHIATQVQNTGGLSRMMLLWMTRDKDRQHSLALTRQQNRPIPNAIQDAVKRSGGRIVRLDQGPTNLIDRAMRLRNFAANFDLAILHIWNEDVVPSIAFSNCANKPRVLFLDHADHMFWVGVLVSDLIISMRDSGMNLARERRGVDASRNPLLPIALDDNSRSHTRTIAKQMLGYPEDSIVILSVARAVKYRTLNGCSFADAHIDILKRHPHAYHVVVGAGERKDWAAAVSSVNGRIRTYAETPDTKLFFEAADIYVDSFPFVSITSMLEAGMYGLPLVTRIPYPGSVNQVLGSDAPGLRDHVIRASTNDEYVWHVSRLIGNQTLRNDLGLATRLSITNTHTGDMWMQNLEEIYSKAIDSPQSNPRLLTAGSDHFCADAPDIYIESAFGRTVSIDGLLRQYNYSRFLPIDERLALACMQFTIRTARKLRKILQIGAPRE